MEALSLLVVYTGTRQLEIDLEFDSNLFRRQLRILKSWEAHLRDTHIGNLTVHFSLF